MTKTVIEMARDAEQFADKFCESIEDSNQDHWFDAYNDHFAALVREDEGKRLVWACEEARSFNKSFEWLNGFDACAAVLNAERIEL